MYIQRSYLNNFQTVLQKQSFYPKIVDFGENNVEPQIIADSVNNCGLAVSCVEILGSFLNGDGFLEDIGNIECNKNGDTLNDILSFCAEQTALFNGFALHFDYNPFLQITEITPVQYQFCRKSFPFGKVAVWDNWAGESPKINNFYGNIEWFSEYKHGEAAYDVRKKFESFDDFDGQVGLFGYRKNGATYPLSPIRPILKDVQSYAVQANFRYRAAKNNFSATKIIEYVGDMTAEQRKNLQKQVSEFMGDENAGSVMILNGGFRDDNGNFQSALSIKDVDIASVDRLFEVQHEQIQTNISRAFRIPLELFSLNQNKGLNSGGETLKSAYTAYNNFTQKQRNWLASELSPILSNFLGYQTNAGIKPLIFNNYEIL